MGGQYESTRILCPPQQGHAIPQGFSWATILQLNCVVLLESQFLSLKGGTKSSSNEIRHWEEIYLIRGSLTL